MFHAHAYCLMVAKWLLQLWYHIHSQQTKNKEGAETMNSPLDIKNQTTFLRNRIAHLPLWPHCQKSSHLASCPQLRGQEISIWRFRPPCRKAEREKTVPSGYWRYSPVCLTLMTSEDLFHQTRLTPLVPLHSIESVTSSLDTANIHPPCFTYCFVHVKYRNAKWTP